MSRYQRLPTYLASLAVSPFCLSPGLVSFCAGTNRTSAATCHRLRRSPVRLARRATDRVARDASLHASPRSSNHESGEREHDLRSFFQGRLHNVARETGSRYEKKRLLDTYHSCPRKPAFIRLAYN